VSEIKPSFVSEVIGKQRVGIWH